MEIVHQCMQSMSMWWYCNCVQQDERESIKNKREYRFSRTHETIRFEWTNRLAALSPLCEQYSLSFWHGCWCTATGFKKKLILLFIWKTEKIFQRTGRNHQRDATRSISKRCWTARRWTHHLYISRSGSDYFDCLFLFFLEKTRFPSYHRVFRPVLNFYSPSSSLLEWTQHWKRICLDVCLIFTFFSHNFSSFFFPALSLLVHSLIPSSHTFL